MSIDISKAADMAGFIGACMVDSDTGLMLTSQGGGKLDLEAASALVTQVVKANLQVIETLELDDRIEDILITLGKQIHLIRPLATMPNVFIYVALDRATANLGMARLQLKSIEAGMSF